MFIAQAIGIRGSDWNQTLGFGMMWLVCNKLPVSAARWQHGSEICFATLVY